MKSITAASLTAIIGIAILTGLGVWQLERREWKTKLIADLTQRESAPAIAWKVSGPTPPEFTHVTVEGDLRTDRPLLLYGRTLNGAAGVHELAALIRDDGAAVLIDEGFSPLPVNGDDIQHAPIRNRRIEGLIRYAPGKAWFDADNDDVKNEWFWIDLPRMAKVLGLPYMAPVYVEATVPVETDGPTPTGGVLAGQIRNEHLTYAITWFSLAGVFAAVYAVWLHRKLKPA
jgi:surfeit locus 1 family protein